MKSTTRLYNNYLQVQEMERKRIAQELHDTSLQNLTHTIHEIELAKLYMEHDIIRAKLELEDISISLKNIIDDIRQTIFNLCPMTLDDLGFNNAIERYLDGIKRQNNFKIVTNIDIISIDDSDAVLNIYRIIQECISNIIKHAKACNISIDIFQKNDYIEIIIKDDGIGFDVDMVTSLEKYNHFGLLIIKERIKLLNGTYNLISKENEGTKINIMIPCKGGLEWVQTLWLQMIMF